MADEHGSDLDVFEGLTKKKKDQTSSSEGSPDPTETPSDPSAPASPPDAVPRAAGTMRGGLASSPPHALPPAKAPPKRSDNPPPAAVLPAAQKVESRPPVALPLPTPPPERRSAAILDVDSEIVPELTAELRRPSQQELARASLRAALVSESPEAELAVLGSEPPQPHADTRSMSVLPGEAAADLDWDDEQESTSVFDKSSADLFESLGGGRSRQEPDDTARRDVGKAAALLAGSGRQASIPPEAVPPPATFTPMPKIPAPAPVPRELSQAAGSRPSAEPVRAQAPSWAPSVPPPAQAAGASRSLWFLAAVALVVLGVAGFFYLRSTGPGMLVVRVTHKDQPVDTAAVFVDGQRKCDFSPCRVEVDSGPREIRVASASLAGKASVTVKGGSETEIVVALGVAAEAAPAGSEQAADQKPAALSLKTPMTEAIKVFVDGQAKGTLPLDLKELKPGQVTLRFETSGDKYGKLEQTILLKPGETLKLEDVKLPLKQVKVTFKLETTGAAVKLIQDGKGDSALTFAADVADKKLDTASTWKIVATLKGYKDFEQTIAFADGKAEQTISIKLDKQEEVAAAPVDAAAATGAVPPPPPPPDDAGGMGMINANSLPPSSVLIDGRPHGQTPVSGVKVTAGSHTVVFKHKDLGVQSRSVTVAPGKTQTVVVKFELKSGGDGDDKPKKKKKKSDDE